MLNLPQSPLARRRRLRALAVFTAFTLFLIFVVMRGSGKKAPTVAAGGVGTPATTRKSGARRP